MELSLLNIHILPLETDTSSFSVITPKYANNSNKNAPFNSIFKYTTVPGIQCYALFFSTENCVHLDKIKCVQKHCSYLMYLYFCLEQTSRRQLAREIGNGLSAEMSFFCKNLTYHLKYICCKCTTNTRCSLYSFKYETYEPKYVL